MKSNSKNMSEILNTQLETTLINQREPLNHAVTMFPDNANFNVNIPKNINYISFVIEDVKYEMRETFEVIFFWIRLVPSCCFFFSKKGVENS